MNSLDIFDCIAKVGCVIDLVLEELSPGQRNGRQKGPNVLTIPVTLLAMKFAG